MAWAVAPATIARTAQTAAITGSGTPPRPARASASRAPRNGAGAALRPSVRAGHMSGDTVRSRPSPRRLPRIRLTPPPRRARSRGRVRQRGTWRCAADVRRSRPGSPRRRVKIVSASTAASVVEPVGAAISTTRRVPSRSMPRCTTRSMQLATVGTTKAESMLRPASRGRVQSFTSASCAEFAWIVHMPGSPEFSAMSRSRLSASRTSPTTRRSGRMRSASLMRRRRVISPVPSRLGWRHCIETRSRTSRSSSNVSSTVTTRSSTRAPDMRALSIVVLPVCVAPDTRMLAPASTPMRRNSAAWRRDRAELDELTERADAALELADVHRPVRPGHIGDGHVQSRAVGQGRVDEGRGEVDATTRVLQHPLDELAHLAVGEHDGRELGDAVARHEHPHGRVDPDLLDGRGRRRTAAAARSR